MRISKLFFAGIFLALILGASFVSANSNMQSKLSALQAQEAQLLGENKTLKMKLEEVKEEIAKKKKGIIAGLVIGGVGGATGAGGMIYAKNTNTKTRVLQKDIAGLKEKPQLVDDIMTLALGLCKCGSLNSCTLISSGAKFTAKKSDLLQKDVIQLKVIKADLQNQKTKKDEFLVLVKEVEDLESELSNNLPAEYVNLTDAEKKWKDCAVASTNVDGWNLPTVKTKLASLNGKKGLTSLFDATTVLYEEVLVVAVLDAGLSNKTYSKEKVEAKEPLTTDTNAQLQTKKQFLEKAKVFYTNFNPTANAKTDFKITVLNSKGEKAKNATVKIAGVSPVSEKKHVYTYNTKPTTGKIEIISKDGKESFSNADITSMAGYDDNAININLKQDVSLSVLPLILSKEKEEAEHLIVREEKEEEEKEKEKHQKVSAEITKAMKNSTLPWPSEYDSFKNSLEDLYIEHLKVIRDYYTTPIEETYDLEANYKKVTASRVKREKEEEKKHQKVSAEITKAMKDSTLPWPSAYDNFKNSWDELHIEHLKVIRDYYIGINN